MESSISFSDEKIKKVISNLSEAGCKTSLAACYDIIVKNKVLSGAELARLFEILDHMPVLRKGDTL